jgi:DNA-binding beta-propeller fold protein YncE
LGENTLRSFINVFAICIVVLCLASSNFTIAQDAKIPSDLVLLPGLQSNSQVLLPNGWSLAPVGVQIEMGDFPVNIANSPDGKFAAVLHAGYGDHQIRIVSLETNKVISTANLQQTFFGLIFSQDGKTVYASGAEDERIYAFPFDNGYLGAPKLIILGDKKDRLVVSGMAELSNKQLLVCALLGNELLHVDVEGSRTTSRVSLPKDSYPYSVHVSPDSQRAYVSLWGLASIAVVDLKNGKLEATWNTRSHPTEMIALDDGRLLLVACADDNSVVMLDTTTGHQREIIRTSLFPTAQNGSTPASIAVSPDQKVLVAANADNNNLAVFDITQRGQSKSLGFIPVGWYPTSVRFANKGDKILVANGKGSSSRANRGGPNPLVANASVREYIGGLFDGTVSVIPSPSPSDMAQYTKTAFSVSPLKGEMPIEPNTTASIIPRKQGDPCPIKHCLYIIKENRTYDQVFGDMPQGNGEPNLCIFPENVTPNHHALARQFVLLDNFYVESEVSADGHEWSMAAYATDFVEKTWPLTYRGGRGKLSYPSEGNFKIAEPSSKYIWDKCIEHGISFFTFGEFIDNGPTPNDPATTTLESLQGRFDPQFRGYDLDYPDVKRAERFIQRWKQFEADGNLPGMLVLRLPNDHTYGTRVGKPTPTAMVADNDLALGMVIEAISNSPSWKETAIFVVQDDAQNGSDHVDAHRTVALAISPYIRRGTVDSTMYSTSSMLRTMELILGMSPMTQFDAAAKPMYQSFGVQPDYTPYKALAAQVDLQAQNLAGAWGAEASEKLDLAKEDAADDLLFGDIVWRSVRGPDSPMPPPIRSAFVFAGADEDEDDEEEGDDEEADAEHEKADEPDSDCKR